MINLSVTKTNGIQKVRGLIGQKRPRSLLIKTRFGIHTFGVKYPIDVAILNNQQEVVVLKRNLRPNGIFLWNPKYSHVLELPEGTIHKKNLRIGEKINLSYL